MWISENCNFHTIAQIHFRHCFLLSNARYEFLLLDKKDVSNKSIAPAAFPAIQVFPPKKFSVSLLYWKVFELLQRVHAVAVHALVESFAYDLYAVHDRAALKRALKDGRAADTLFDNLGFLFLIM